jgi:predicted DCC family thiol-disulfide oxidoreductase YuxK
LVDIASETYDPSSNRGVDFETAMSTIHGITNEGEVITGVAVFERAYAAVGLGWVYAFTKVPALSNAATALYDFWAERRLAVTGRPTYARGDAVERTTRSRRRTNGVRGGDKRRREWERTELATIVSLEII